MSSVTWAPNGGSVAKRLTVVSAGLSQPSSTRLLAERLARATVDDLNGRGLAANVEILEVAGLAYDLTSRLVNGLSSGALDAALDRLRQTDGLIAVTPVFAASYSGLFKSLFDVVDPEALVGVPVLIGATGGSDRHSLVLDHALRPLFAHLKAVVGPTGVYAATADWGSTASSGSGLGQRVRRAAAELATLVERGSPREVSDPFALPAGFDPAGRAGPRQRSPHDQDAETPRRGDPETPRRGNPETPRPRPPSARPHEEEYEMTAMQFGVFSTGYLEQDPPITGPVVRERETIAETMLLAQHAEEVGLDVFAFGEHHNPPFFSSSPPAVLSYLAAKTSTIQLTTSTTLITTNDPVKLAEDYAVTQHLAEGRLDLMLGRGNTGPVYPWFGRDIRDGISLAVENYALLRQLWDTEVVDWEGQFRTPLSGFTSVPRPLEGVPPFVWHASIRSPEIAEQAAYYGDGFFANNIFWPPSHFQKLVNLYRQRFEHYGHGTAAQAIVGLGGHVFIRPRSQDAKAEFLPYFRSTSFGQGVSLDSFTRQTPLTVGSPQEVIERYAGMRDLFGDYHRQLFLLNIAGMPLKTTLEQLDALGEIVPVLRAELDRDRPAEVPDVPTHASRVAARRAHREIDRVPGPTRRQLVSHT